MQKLEVFGANKLKGQIKISGSKNASLPILAATLISSKKIYLKKLPKVQNKKAEYGYSLGFVFTVFIGIMIFGCLIIFRK